MRICAAQTRPHRGNLQANLRDHLRVLHHAAGLGADVLVFPELSLTGYEPRRAAALALDVNTALLDGLQQRVDETGVSTLVGMPIRAQSGIHISIVVLQPGLPPRSYAKQRLHADELPYFVPGEVDLSLELGGRTLALGICYEAMQRDHVARAQGADGFVASVAKSEAGVRAADAFFREVAAEFSLPIVMANFAGECEDFEAAGQSAVWSRAGTRLCGLGAAQEGLVLYDVESGTARTEALDIAPARPDQVAPLFALYQRARRALEARGVFQWTDAYPTLDLFQRDVAAGLLHALCLGEELLGAVQLSEQQERVYAAVPWALDDPRPLVVHRLVVDPELQGFGYASRLMDFAERYGRAHGHASIRLDVYSDNRTAIAMYEGRGFQHRGDVRFPGRSQPFHCMEKVLS